MKIIRYFCIMKRFKDFFITICLVVLSSLTTYAQTQVTNESARQTAADDITISLLTCSPGSQVWSLYGHTAIRFQDPAHDVDLAINYGMFNFNQKNFIARFVFGITDYEMGIEPFAFFLQEYARNGRGYCVVGVICHTPVYVVDKNVACSGGAVVVKIIVSVNAVRRLVVVV